MRKYFIRPGFDFLQLFADGGSAGEGGGTGTGAAAEAAGQTEAEPAQPQSKGVKNPLANVQYGNEAEPAAAVQEQADDKEARFEALIKGEFKDQYDARVQSTIQRRFRGSEEAVNRLKQITPVLGMLAEKYGVDANDIDALSKAVEDDESLYEEEAIEKGLTVQQVKEVRKMQRENEELKRKVEERQSLERANAAYAAMMQEAEEVKKVYPNFDLSAEMKNDKFFRLVKNNIDLKSAFEAVHIDEIIPTAMQYAAKRVESKVASGIAAGRKRPAEAAMGNQAPIVSKRDVSQLTPADRREIIRRASRGVKIGFD